jgi:isoleucyl-tRNA synthetase
VQPLDARPADLAPTTLDDGTEFYVQVTPLDYGKCVRCWHRREDVGAHAEHPELCGRCVENVAGQGETRRYA